MALHCKFGYMFSSSNLMCNSIIMIQVIDPRVICTVAVQALHRSRRWRTVSLRQWRREGGAYKHRVRHIIKPPETTAKKIITMATSS